jgi:hypothetical protein
MCPVLPSQLRHVHAPGQTDPPATVSPALNEPPKAASRAGQFTVAHFT